MNKHALNGLIKDVQLQLQKNTERLNHHLSKNERAQILGENEAIAITIEKLQGDLKGVNELDEEEQDNQEEQQSFIKPLALVEKEKREKEAKQFAKDLGIKPDTNSQKKEKTFAEVLGVNRT